MYTYNDFLNDLKLGLEFHFTYNNIEYSISYLKGKVLSIGAMGTDNFKEFSSSDAMLQNFKIENNSIEDIFNNITFDCIF